VEALKRERREAEARMLKKDADAIELRQAPRGSVQAGDGGVGSCAVVAGRWCRFDLEERNLEVGRLRRRVAELEAIARPKTLTPGGDLAKPAKEDDDRKGGGRFKRER
jgi:hypothetical protein